MGAEIELGGARYSLGRLSAKQQFHISRRIAPIVPSLLPLYSGLLANRQEGEGLTADSAALLQPLADGIAGLRDEDADYIIDTCLSAVQRQQDGRWVAVWSPTQRVLMFQDIELAVMLPLVVRVIVENLGPFIRGLLTSPASGPAPAQAAAQAG
ncbi:probable bacteriophage protein STY1060 [plant metagenome]|uniref:Probable bacteriophage protein STY1060 n=1 Tax=plant metagenome TaxID=1297885 RepID=A0A484TZJ0_9ZZZZ